jgi:hypothetical protein
MTITRIVLDGNPEQPQPLLALADSVSCKPIREALNAWSSGRADLAQAKKDLTTAEQELPASEWKDAELEAEAVEAGSAVPKTRQHTAKHEQLIRDLLHRVKVTTLTEVRAQDAAQEALDAHLSEWQEQITAEAEALAGEWQEALPGLIELYGRMASAHRVEAKICGEAPSAHAIKLTTRQLTAAGAAIAVGGPKVVHIPAEEVLAGLADLGQPQPEPEPKRKPETHEDRLAEQDKRMAAEATDMARARGIIRSEGGGVLAVLDDEESS